jgi:DNA-binding cell septation regulator SpoVG
MILWNPFNSESLSERNTDEKEIKDIAHYFNKAGEYLKTAMLDYYNKLDDDLREKISKNIKETAY